MGEAILSLGVDWWKDGFAVDLKSSPQGLPDLLRVCNNTTKLSSGPLDSQHPPTRPLEPGCVDMLGKGPQEGLLSLL